jgi:ubiquitin carboxyl-terminal hydrolase L3
MWFPLESNPTVMNTYMRKLGMNTDKYTFHDVFSTEDWALEMIPRPVIAMLMLYPITAETEKYSHAEQESIKSKGQVLSDKVKFIKQTIGNACGTIALLHAASNGVIAAPELVKPDTYLARFESSMLDKSSDEIAESLEKDTELEEVHEVAADEGDSKQVEDQGDVDTHFICFVHIDGHLYELGKSDF